MPGILLHVPTEGELERLYFELARLGAPSVGRRARWPYRPANGEALVALAGEMLRYDARLLSILVQFAVRQYVTLNPQVLRLQMRSMRWPQALLVALEFAKAAASDDELHWYCDYVAAGWSRTNPSERFFLDLERPASRTARRGLGRNLAPYSRWGFIGRERPVVDPITKRTVGRYDAQTRRAILSGLVDAHESITMAEYLAAVDHSVSRQQARLDFRAVTGLSRRGTGRGARWVRSRAAKQRM